ncbi:PREDICTED: E3 ubiquitin-protein ligase RBBP6-like isoform X1 [Acromyrmex echinatior]|uniref:Uncharacterized protein n=1 Tax=Acromyrmex echinatior TaxID=103372 RepID=F4X8T2_ACREC|nr:PREDICTED: E3 ubiquitin-protein ligase RBBP6-like isoform X1 [Acromyrmex echinatior]EGI57351.1 hypothetical protein G5I_14822 [Acromyrmex echinatior]
MKTFRKLIVMVLLLLIYLLTLQVGDAERNPTKISNTSDSEIILEEVIIAGSGNNTRVIANAVAKDASKLDDEVFSLLSKREIQESRRSKTSSDQDDQDAAQSRAAVINANEEDELEMMSHVIAKYEPQRLTTRKTKRKIIDGSNDTHDVHDKVEGSITDIERAYAEVLKNISRKAPELTVNNADVALNPYLSLAKKQLKQIYIPKGIPSAINDRAEKSHSDVEPTFTLPTSNSKKSKRLLKKYLQLNRTATTPRFSLDEESNFDEESASSKPSTPVGYFKVSNGKTKVKNESLSVPTSNVYSDPTKNPKTRHEWDVKDSSIQTVPPLTQLNNSNFNNIINVNNFKNLNVSNYANTDQLPQKYNIVPRPFSILQSPNSFVITNDASHRKPSVLPTDFNRQQQIVRSSANILPLVLPTDLFNPLATRRYIPIKRTNHLNPEGNSATIVSTEASLPTSPVGKKTTLTDYKTFYTDVIDTTRSPLVTVNNQQSYGSSDYYAITESPTERTVTKTNFATTYIPSQTSPLHTAQGQKDSQIVRKKDFLPTISSYNSLSNEKSSLNENPEIALYKKFSNLYSVPNVLNTPKVITQDFKQAVQPSQQQVSTLPDATLKPLTPTLLNIRPIITSKPTPYYDSRSFVLQDGKHKKNSDENVGTNEQSRVEDVDVTEKEDDDVENYKTQVNEKAYKTPNKLSEKKDREEEEEDRDLQQNHNYQDKHYEYDENDRSSKNDDRREKYENVWRENNDGGEEDETEEEEYDDNIDKSKDEDNDDNHRQYNKYRYDRDNSDEKQRENPRHEKYNKPKDRRDEHDVDHRFEDKNKYLESLYNDDEIHERNKEYRDRSDQKKLIGNNQYKKDRQNRKYKEFEDESVAKNKPFTPRSKDLRSYKQDERYEEEQSNDDDKRKYHSYASPRRDSLREKHLSEESSESNPTHIHEEYHHQRVKDDHRRHDGEDQDNGKEEARDHVHGETQEHAETHKHEEHDGKKKDIKNYKFEKGGGAEHEEEHHGHEGEKGDKGYKVWHENEKAEKGHHDKEHASKQYDEKAGEEKKHEEEGGYHEEHKHGEGGKKTAEFGEKGEHKKGHSTHGEHSVHKKDEYEKKTEFFDEFNEDGGIEKHGEHHHDHESEKGGHEKKGHHDSSDHEEKYGKEGKHEKGGHHHEHKGHKVDEGHDHHYDHHHKHGKKEGHEHGKKWSFKKGDGDDHKHNR